MYELARAADVKVTKNFNAKGAVVASIVVNDTYTHEFAASSRVSKHLEMMEPEFLQDRLSGGQFFFVENQLVDFRDNTYHGFTHTDSSIDSMAEVLGYSRVADLPLHTARKHRGDEILLRKSWSDYAIIVPGYADGGNFNSELSFTWNPFEKMINSNFDLVRLICANGMVGMTSLLSSKVPLINRWNEHLDIAARQIQNKVNTIVVERVKKITTEHASVGDCLLLEQHIIARLESDDNVDSAERDRLFNMLGVVAPQAHLSSIYKDNVFADKNLASQLPAHISLFDAYNTATELRTHTNENAKSSNSGLDRIANQIMFDREDSFVASAVRYTAPKMSSWTSPEEAFIGG
jgi:hypothetical protein